MAVIEFIGSLSRSGVSQGHYICDVKDANSKLWYRTDDSRFPVELKVSDVSKNPYVVMYKRVKD